MKKLKQLFFLSALTLLSISTAFGQKETPKLPIDSSTNKITYSEVVFVDSLANKQELFSRAREWFAKAYVSSINVIQMEDKESGKIIGKALMSVHYTSLGYYVSGKIHYTISISCKDGRYKYEITDFYHTGEGGGSDGGVCEKMLNVTSGKKVFNQLLTQLDDNIKALIVDLKAAMIVKAANTKKDAW